MSYGMEILTPNGLESVANLRSFREVYRDTKASTSGSQVIPGGADGDNASVTFEVNDDKNPPTFSWSGSTLSWSAVNFGSGATSDFVLIVLRFK